MRKTHLAVQISAAIALSATMSSMVQANDDVLALEEVIVTAQKREQSAQDVPIAMSAVSSDDMERMGATEIKDIQFSTPSLAIVGGNPILQSYGIRGVADRGRNPGYDQRVGVYIDGVWVGKSAASNQSALDVAAVEVLNGPQGTLFGKNTVAVRSILPRRSLVTSWQALFLPMQVTIILPTLRAQLTFHSPTP